MKSKKWAIVRLSAVLVALAFVLIVRIYFPNNTFLKILCLSILAITAGAHLIAMRYPIAVPLESSPAVCSPKPAADAESAES